MSSSAGTTRRDRTAATAYLQSHEAFQSRAGEKKDQSREGEGGKDWEVLVMWKSLLLSCDR